MLWIEITAPSGGWVDHNGSHIDRLVFSKAYIPNYIPGYYPLESLGSLYRNIENFRESPLQSRTDWEIRVPSIYSDGDFQTVDLLYFLEDINERNGRDFDLIGCEAKLYDNEALIYLGMVESVVTGSATSALRISDWLGNPKSAKRNFPTSIGSPAGSYWQVKVTREKLFMHLEISDRDISKPNFYVKIGGEFIKVYDSGIIKYSQGNRSAKVYFSSGNYPFLPAAITAYDPIRLPTTVGSFNLDTWRIIRPEIKDTPDYFLLGEPENLEIVEAWTNRNWQWEFDDNPIIAALKYFWIGRRDNRRPHPQNADFNRISESGDMEFRMEFSATPESIVLDSESSHTSPPFARGDPFRLIENSRNESYEEGDVVPGYGSDISINILKDGVFGIIAEFSCEFTVKLALPEGIPSDAATYSPASLYLAIRYNSLNNDRIKYTGSIEVDGKRYSLPESNLNGAIVRIALYKNEYGTPISSMTTVKIKFIASIHRFAKTQDFRDAGPINVRYVKIVFPSYFKLSGNKLYAKADFADGNDNSNEATEDGMRVTPLLRRLLGDTNVLGFDSIPVSGNDNDFRYAGLLKADAFALRDKLRSLATESSTMLLLNPAKKEIIVKSIILQENQNRVEIPFSAFVLEGNIFRFKMESADRSELLSELSIFWEKDLETDRFVHSLNISQYGILLDGEDYSNYITTEQWNQIFSRLAKNTELGIGTHKTFESEWLTNAAAAESMAYNMLRWNIAPMRKAQAVCIFTELGKLKDDDGNPIEIDIGTFVFFDLPGYPSKMRDTYWLVTGRHDDLDGMVSTLELLEASGQADAQMYGYLLLESGDNMLLESGGKIRLEDRYEQ